MFEVELKLPVEHETIRPRLLELGFESVDVVTETDRYFEAPFRSFAVTDEALRLRCTHDRDEHRLTTELTYKGPRLDEHAKTRVEHECIMADVDDAMSILEALDFRQVATIEKRRERLRRGDVTATLDDVSGLGEFLELERVVTADELDGVGAELDRTVVDLGFAPDDVIDETYLELMLENNSK